MVSGFICMCHGFMSYGDKRSYKLFEAGTAREGWFTNNDLIKQLEDFAEGFKALHPNKDIYNNSMTHRAKASDGLDISKLNLSDGGVNAPKLRDGWYIKDGVHIVQKMQHPNGVQKGMHTILEERYGFRRRGILLRKLCRYCKQKTPEEDRILYTKGSTHQIYCCASKVLAGEPDFMQQRDALTEVVESAGMNIFFFPKYHCELNCIENVWGWLKQYFRKKCQYNYDFLKTNLPDVMSNQLQIAFINRCNMRCFRFMSGYRLNNLIGPALENAVKCYSSHRKIPSNYDDEDEKKRLVDMKKKKKRKHNLN
jgi:hypothetical protein